MPLQCPAIGIGDKAEVLSDRYGRLARLGASRHMQFASSVGHFRTFTLADFIRIYSRHLPRDRLLPLHPLHALRSGVSVVVVVDVALITDSESTHPRGPHVYSHEAPSHIYAHPEA